mgnify:CR=1 FL=1
MRWSIKLRSLKPLLVPVALNLILALVRPWTVADFTSLWFKQTLEGEPAAVFSAVLTKRMALVWPHKLIADLRPVASGQRAVDRVGLARVDERARDVEQYWEVVQGAWQRAVERFTKSISDPKAAPIKSGRDMLDAWLEIANASLLEMHRSKEFLEAQRRMTRSSTEYRLAEREIAEAFCEMHHIPTRTEMDEIQKSMVELKRELRTMRRGQQAASDRPRAAPKGKPRAKAKGK